MQYKKDFGLNPEWQIIDNIVNGLLHTSQWQCNS
jgi:hypothetical protein